MNKTVSANISGIVFNIEEAAYEVLSTYLNTIRGYFSATEGQDEILSDIEARIAELFSAKINDRKNVITASDVDEVMSIMGEPEQYIDEEEMLHQQAATDNGESEPAAQAGPQTRSRKRRLFRDPENNMLGGVCSGIAAHFGWDPIGFRVAFVFLGLVIGSGVFLYILLWALIPKAKTTAEKLEMHGEDVNVDNISRQWSDKMKEGADNLERNISNIDADYHVDRAKRAANKAGDAAKSVFSAFSRVFGIALIVGAIGMIIFAASLLTGTDVFITFSENSNVTSLSYNELSDILFSSVTMANMAFWAIIILIGVPFVYAMVAGFKLSFKMDGSLRVFGITCTILMLIGATLAFFVGIDTGKQFNQNAEVIKILPIAQPNSDTLHVDLIDDHIFSNNFSDHHDYFFELIETIDDEIILGNAYLDVKRSHSDSFEIIATIDSQGPTQKEAIRLAEEVNYAWHQSDSSHIAFSPNFKFTKENRFRGQHLKFEIRVPLGKSIKLAPLTDRIIYDVKNVTNTKDEDMVGKIWTMTTDGLTCIGCQL